MEDRACFNASYLNRDLLHLDDMHSIRVLYIHPVGPAGGASRSLLELVSAFSQGSVQVHILAQAGPAADLFESAGFQVERAFALSQFNHTFIGYYRGARWLVLLREVLLWPYTWYVLRRTHRRWPQIDLIHLNTSLCLVTGILVKRLYRCPMLIHYREVMQTRVGKWRSYWCARLLRRHIDYGIAIDENVYATLQEVHPIEIIHNGFNPHSSPGSMLPPSWPVRQPGETFFGMVGVVIGYKGVFDFVEAARICRQQGAAIQCIFVGEDIPDRGMLGPLYKMLGLWSKVMEELKAKVRAYGLEDCVHFVGFMRDVAKVYEALDVLCFPSHLEGIGRPVFEAGFFARPSIVAMSVPNTEIVIPDISGIYVPPRQPDALAQAMLRLHNNPDERKRMGAAARQIAIEKFSSQQNSKRVLDVYRRLTLDKSAPLCINMDESAS